MSSTLSASPFLRRGVAALLLTMLAAAALATFGSRNAPASSSAIGGSGHMIIDFDPALIDDFSRHGVRLDARNNAKRLNYTRFKLPFTGFGVDGGEFAFNSRGGIKFLNAKGNNSGKNYTFSNFSLLTSRNYLVADNNGPHRAGLFTFSPIFSTLHATSGKKPWLDVIVNLGWSPVSARTLNKTFKTSQFQPGANVGTAHVQVRLRSDQSQPKSFWQNFPNFAHDALTTTP